MTEVMTHLSVGEGIMAYEQMTALPVGTMIGPDTRETYRKVDAVTWEHTSDGTMANQLSFALRGYNKVQSLPTGKVKLLSLAQWQWLWRDNALFSAEQAGVSLTTVLQACEQLGCEDDRFSLGKGMRVKSSYDRNRLPHGTVAYLGKPTGVLRQYGVLVKRPSDDWSIVLGDNQGIYGGTLTVESVPDGTVAEWATTPGTEAEQEAVADFKAHAWRIGWKAKLAHRWCSSYETYMEQIGMTADVLRHAKSGGISIGDRINPEQAAALPVGSVLRWRKHDDQSQFAWFVRDDGMSNRAGTVRLFSSDGVARHYASAMEVLWIQTANAGDWAIPVPVAEARFLPIGARLENGGTPYRVARDHRIQNDGSLQPRGTWDAGQFGTLFTLVGVA